MNGEKFADLKLRCDSVVSWVSTLIQCLYTWLQILQQIIKINTKGIDFRRLPCTL